jgi:acetyl-CoA decarbonylase/synthase complex subunit beta
MPSTIKKRVENFIDQDIIEKIATENDVSTIDELKVFLEKKLHPIVQRWKTDRMEPIIEEDREITEETVPIGVSTLPITAGGFKIVLKDAKIYAKKVIIRRTEQKKK